jgi:glucose/arabinose dehydrogenase
MVRFVVLGLIAAATIFAGIVGLKLTMMQPDPIPDRVEFQTSAGPVQVERMASPFAHPWALAFLPDGSMLVTERGGTLWHLAADGGRTSVAGVPAVKAEGQGGLLDVTAAGDFKSSRLIFLTYSEPDGAKSRTAVASARLSEDGMSLEDLSVIFNQSPSINSDHHYGSRIVEAPEGTLWVTLGERGQSTQAQNIQTHLGKVVRITRDDKVPAGNPMAGGLGRPEIWSFGHRNPQGAALDPATGALWIVDHGAKGGDEINRPEPGKNYGWPVISYGTTYAGTKIGSGTAQEGMEQPIYYWDPSIAPSGMLIYSGKLWPEWRGHIFVGALKFNLISRLTRDADGITGEEQLFEGAFGRVRDLREAPDGAIWFLTDEDQGALYRVSPVN